MKLKRIFTSVAAIATAALSFTATAATELNASSWFPDSHPLAKVGYLDWAKKVEKASNGDIKIKVYTGHSLLPANAHLSGLRDGIAHITYHPGTYTPSDIPEDNVLAMLAIGMNDPYVTAFAVTDFYLNDPTMQERWKRNKIVYLGGYATTPYNLICRKRVANLADLKGLKLRTPGATHADWARSVGATPVNVSSSEIFTGLDKGQIDCAVIPVNELKARSFWDVAKFANTLNLGPYYAGWQWAMNAGTWAKLNPKQRKILIDTVSDSIVDTLIAYDESDKQAVSESKSHGVEIIPPAKDAQDSVVQFAPAARTAAIQEAQKRFKLKDADGLVTRFEAVVKKWEKLLAGVNKQDAAAMKVLTRQHIYSNVNSEKYGM